MTGLPTRAQVESIRKQYPKGTKVRMIRMADDPNPIAPGAIGEVDFVDDSGQAHTTWRDGRTLAFIPYVDSVAIISDEEYAKGGGQRD